jgi:PII-like signaling protein
MKGFLITFYTVNNRTVGDTPMVDWLLALVDALDLKGATVNGSLLGRDATPVVHRLTIFDDQDQPVQIRMVLTPEEAERVLNYISDQSVNIFYTKAEVEFGLT